MAIVQENKSNVTGQSTSPSHTLGFTPTSGNLLIGILTCGADAVNTPPSGWTERRTYIAITNMVSIYEKVSNGAETSITWAVNEDTYFGISVFEYSGLDAFDQYGENVNAATQSLTVTAPGQNAVADSLCITAALVYDDDVIITDSAGWVQEHIISQANWMNQYVGTRVTTALETPSNTIDVGGGVDKEVQLVLAVWSGPSAVQTSGTINGGGGITASVTKVLNQILRPTSTTAAGNWDTGPTTGQSLHGYTSDDSDTTYIDDAVV